MGESPRAKKMATGNVAAGTAHLKHFECIVTPPPVPDGELSVFFTRDELTAMCKRIVGTPLWVEHGNDTDAHTGDQVDRGKVGWVGEARICEETGRMIAKCTLDRSADYGVEAVQRMERGDLGAVSLGWNFIKHTDPKTGDLTLLDKRESELSLVAAPDVEGAVVTQIADNSERWNLRLLQAERLLGLETSARKPKSPAGESTPQPTAQNDPESETCAVSASKNSPPGNTMPATPEVTAAAAAAVAAAAAAATADPAPASASASNTDEAAALRAQIAVLTRENRELSVTAQTPAMTPDVEAILAKHAADLASKSVAMKDALAAMRDKIAADLEKSGTNIDVDALMGHMTAMADDPERSADLFQYVSAAAGASASARATQMQEELVREQERNKEVIAQAASERERAESLARHITELERQMSARDAVMGMGMGVGVGSKRPRPSVAPAPGYAVRFGVPAQIPSTPAAMAAPSVVDVAASAAAQPGHGGAAHSAAAAANAAAAAAAAASAAADAEAAASQQAQLMVNVPSGVQPMAHGQSNLLDLFRKGKEGGVGMGTFDNAGMVGLDYGARPQGVDPETGSMALATNIASERRAIQLA